MPNLNNQIIIDVEADGPFPGKYSMVCFGAVCIGDKTKTFYGQTCPISKHYIPEALAISGFTRQEHEGFQVPSKTMLEFKNWIDELQQETEKRVVSWSDNPAFDWQFINHYMHSFTGNNPLGFSMRRIGDYYAGTRHKWNDHTSWKRLRKTSHTHNPVDDAMGNAEALAAIICEK